MIERYCYSPEELIAMGAALRQAQEENQLGIPTYDALRAERDLLQLSQRALLIKVKKLRKLADERLVKIKELLVAVRREPSILGSETCQCEPPGPVRCDNRGCRCTSCGGLARR